MKEHSPRQTIGQQQERYASGKENIALKVNYENNNYKKFVYGSGGAKHENQQCKVGVSKD